MLGFRSGVLVTICAMVVAPVLLHPEAQQLRAWLFGLLSSQSAPAWVQALGSIGAIIAAIWIGRASERRRERGAIKLAVLFSAGALDGIAAAQRACSVEVVELISRALADLKDSYAVGQSVDLTLLTPLGSLRHAQTRSEVAKVIDDLEQFWQKAQANHTLTRGDFSALYSKLEKHYQKVVGYSQPRA